VAARDYLPVVQFVFASVPLDYRCGRLASEESAFGIIIIFLPAMLTLAGTRI
jgi:hypothetical protein